MEAGSDTTTSMLLSTLLLMVKHPEVLKKAQAEVDELCGTTRSPTLKDAPEMPYINAVVEEVCTYSSKACHTAPYTYVTHILCRYYDSAQVHRQHSSMLPPRTTGIRGISYRKTPR